MKICTVFAAASVIALTGCLATAPQIKNSNGQPIKFIEPILGKAAMPTARYVLIEKNIADGKYKMISMAKTRQPITNERQERIAFNHELTGFAPDYTDYNFQTYNDSGNYGQSTVIMNCTSVPQKSIEYGPCNSAFSEVFVPMGVVKAYVAGHMPKHVKDAWEDPRRNARRAVNSPAWALRQAGVFEHLSELANAE